MRYVALRATSLNGKNVSANASERVPMAMKSASGNQSLDLGSFSLVLMIFLKHQMPEKIGMMMSGRMRPLSGPKGTRYSSPMIGKKRMARRDHFGLRAMRMVATKRPKISSVFSVFWTIM